MIHKINQLKLDRISTQCTEKRLEVAFAEKNHPSTLELNYLVASDTLLLIT